MAGALAPMVMMPLLIRLVNGGDGLNTSTFQWGAT